MGETIRVRFPRDVEARFKPAVFETVTEGRRKIERLVSLASGPALYDVESQTQIFQGNAEYDPVEGQEVPVTKFINARIRSGDLVAVRQEVVVKPEPVAAPEWSVDYSRIENKVLVISRSGSDRQLEATVVSSTEGEVPRHTLETYGIVQGQDFWPTPEATDFFEE